MAFLLASSVSLIVLVLVVVLVLDLFEAAWVAPPAVSSVLDS